MAKKKMASTPWLARQLNGPASWGCAAAALLPIAVPFMVAGIAIFVSAARIALEANDWKSWEQLIARTIGGVLFGSVGVAILVGLVLLRRRSSATLAAKFPDDEPWLARSDWAAGRIPGSGAAGVVAPMLGAAALWWTIASVPLVTSLPRLLSQAESAWAWLALLIPLPGLLLASASIYQWSKARKFGKSVFELAGVPGIVGGQLAGVVRIPRAIQCPDGFRVKLTCFESRQEHRKRGVSVMPVWQDERLVTATLGGETANETVVPVLLAIPYDVPETSRPDSERDFEWALELWAAMPHIDYSARFEVPIFKTAESRKDFQLDAGLAADYASPRDNEAVLREAGIVREPLAGGGVRLVFPAARNWRSALLFSMLPVVFLVIPLAIINYDERALDYINVKPHWQAVVNDFGIAALVTAVFRTFLAVFSGAVYLSIVFLFSVASLDLWLYRSVVEATPAGLRVRGGWLGIGREHSFAADDIRQFKQEEYMSSSEGGIWKNVVVVPRKGNGEKRTIGKGVSSKLAVEAVIDELNAALGRGE